eukprot:GHVU01130708.1.p1 GENE.GHVU01130708.1~~GHVU01130708.1.p1  ORF type:complete len:117 (+),score=1.18 GHVU01130708.1:584-934(+)
MSEAHRLCSSDDSASLSYSIESVRQAGRQVASVQLSRCPSREPRVSRSGRYSWFSHHVSHPAMNPPSHHIRHPHHPPPVAQELYASRPHKVVDNASQPTHSRNHSLCDLLVRNHCD